MSNQQLPGQGKPGETGQGSWETRVRALASAYPYPSAPDIAGAVRARLNTGPGSSRVLQSGRQARMPREWAIAAVLVILLSLLLGVPPVRAAVMGVLRLGAVRIFLGEPAAMPTVTATPSKTSMPDQPVLAASPAASALAGRTGLPSAAITAEAPVTATSPAPRLNLGGETTLTEARARAGFPVRLPGYPSTLGPPDRVYLQDLGGPAVVLAWLEEEQKDHVRMSLHELGPGTMVEKVQPRVIEQTKVNGHEALWTDGPYLLRRRNGDYDLVRLIEGHVLIWVEGDVTYRLETNLPLSEAVRVAESLR